MTRHATPVSVCDDCFGTGRGDGDRWTCPTSGKVTGHFRICQSCGGQGIYFDDAALPSPEPPGRELRIAQMAARYAEGLSLWSPADATPARETPFDRHFSPISDMAAAVAEDVSVTHTVPRG